MKMNRRGMLGWVLGVAVGVVAGVCFGADQYVPVTANGDETGFKIVRKDSLTGEYAQVGTADANATTYTETVPAAGTYWYRVKATNANGDSLGSNVAKVTVAAPAKPAAKPAEKSGEAK